jgi:hypothetical protein
VNAWWASSQMGALHELHVGRPILPGLSLNEAGIALASLFIHFRHVFQWVHNSILVVSQAIPGAQMAASQALYSWQLWMWRTEDEP